MPDGFVSARKTFGLSISYVTADHGKTVGRLPQVRTRPAPLSHGGHMKTKTCSDCNGDGVVDKDTDNERQCPTCGGLGFVTDDDDGHEEVIKTLRLGGSSA
jgi:DnaJ-class molecular chaperone